jgi:hypothetical protein
MFEQILAGRAEVQNIAYSLLPKPAEVIAKKGTAIGLVLWTLISIYGGARVLQVFPGKTPHAGVVALHVLPVVTDATGDSGW